MHDDSNANKTETNKVDPNWRDDALNLELDYGMQTIAVRAGQHRTDEGEHSEAIFTTSSYVYESAVDAAAHFNGSKTGNVYSRHTNPSVRTFERRLAALENGERAVATASGMGAILTMCLAYLKAGDHLLAANQLFGSSIGLFNNYMAKFGVEVSYVDCFDNDAWAKAVRPNTKVIYCESPSNPLAQICDIGYLSELCKANDILLVVDNCFATPALQRPLDLGADVVIHSATKYLDGQGRVLGGALVGSDKLMQEAFTVVRSGGISMSPFNAWVFTKGLETLKLRMQAHCRNANQIAEFLVNHPNVSAVHFSGLSDHPAHELATRLDGAIVQFRTNVGFAYIAARRGKIAQQFADHVFIARFLEIGLYDGFLVSVGFFFGQAHQASGPFTQQAIAARGDLEGVLLIKGELSFFGAFTVVEIGH